MAKTSIARLFMRGRSQAVRLPMAFRLPGDRVRARRGEGGILLEPIAGDVKAWFEELDRFAGIQEGAAATRYAGTGFSNDTNAVIAVLNNKPPAVRKKLRQAFQAVSEGLCPRDLHGNNAAVSLHTGSQAGMKPGVYVGTLIFIAPGLS